MRLRWLAPLTALILSSAACGGGGGSAATTGGAATSTTAGVMTTGPGTTAGTTSQTTGTSSTQPAVPGTALMELLTPSEGLGERPLLEWAPVAGAVLYQVTVLEPDGAPYWSWQGEAASVAFGGGPADDPDTSGARLLTAKSWFVAAFDAAGDLLATSPIGRLEP